MAPNGTLAEPLHVTTVEGKLCVAVPPQRADNLQAYLRHNGISCTLSINPAEQVTRLELWPGVDAAAAQTVLDGWTGK